MNRRHDPAAALLIACARSRVQRVPLEIPQGLRHRDDWHRALALAAAHGVLPLMSATILDHASAVPPAVAAFARERLDENVQRTLMLSLELRRVREGLAQAGIRSLALKGPALAERVYGAPYLRRCRDLDLLIEPTRLWRAHEVVQALGYRPFDPLPQLDAAGQQGFLAQAQQAEYGHHSLDAAIDLQCRIAPPFVAAPPFDALWARRATVELPGGPVDVLGGLDLLVALCLHGLRHGWERFQWVVDVAMAARQAEDGEWPAIRAEARRWQAHRALELGITLAARAAGLAPERPGLSWVGSDAASTRVAASAHDALFRALPRWRRAWLNVRVQFRAQQGARDRFAYLKALATTPTAADWLAWRLAPERSWAYLWLRPLRLVADYTGLWKKPPRS
jgi:hypothetical protein